MSTLYVTEDWTFSPSTLTLSYIDTKKEAVLDPKTARLLGYFLRCHPKVCTRDEIYQELYGIENARADGTITAYVSKLRKLLETTPETKGKYLKTIPKTGYQFVGQYNIESVSVKKGSLTPDNSKGLAEAQKEKNSATQATQSSRQTVREHTSTPIAEHASSKHKSHFNWQRLYSVEFCIILVLTVLIAILFKNEHTHNENPENTQSVQLSATDWNLFHAESGINQSVALSSDGLFIAFVSSSKGSNNLFVKGVLGEKLNKVFSAEHGLIESPVFSPNGTQLAFINRVSTQNNHSCDIVLLQLDAAHQVVPGSEQLMTKCDPSRKKSPLAFIDEENLVYLDFNEEAQFSTLASINLKTATSSKLVKGDPIEFGQTFAFAFNKGTNQLALVSELPGDDNNPKSNICIYDLIEKSATHLITTETALSGIEWVNNQKLIVKKGQQLQLVDLKKRDIRPVTLSQLKSELGETKKS